MTIYTDKMLSGMSRQDLLVAIQTLSKSLEQESGINTMMSVERKHQARRIQDLLEDANRREHDNRALKAQVRDLTESVSLAPLAFIVGALQRARAKHPSGPGRGGDGMRTLMEEVGEAASALRKETDERVREELLDVVVVALRMFWGE